MTLPAITDPVAIRLRRPILLTAWQVTDQSCDRIARWCNGTSCDDGGRYIGVSFLGANGDREFAPPGHYIVRGVTGLFVARTPDQYADMYEEVATDGPT